MADLSQKYGPFIPRLCRSRKAISNGWRRAGRPRGPDAIHIAIAQRLGGRLFTFDERMATAAAIVGLETTFNNWKGVWRSTSHHVVTAEANSLVKRHNNRKGWAMLLPVPPFRQNFASNILEGKSILSAEFLFQDIDIPHQIVGKNPVPLGHQLPFFKGSEKTNFANHAMSFGPGSFSGFEPLLARWEDILAGRI